MKPAQVLFVEDNPAEVLLMRHALAKESIPADILIAEDGEKAVRILIGNKFNPDLVILDLELPKVPGLSVLKQIHPRVPVIVFSSSMNLDDIQRSFELGAKDFVSKPMDLESYERLISHLVRKWAFGGASTNQELASR